MKLIIREDIVVMAPVTTEYHEARSNIEETLNAINELKYPTFWFWPTLMQVLMAPHLG